MEQNGEVINKIDRSLARLTGKKKHKGVNEGRNITTDLTERGRVLKK